MALLNNSQETNLNNSMSAAQDVSLGTLIKGYEYVISKISGDTYEAKFGTDESYTLFESDGTMVMAGSATVWDDIFFPLATAKQGQIDKPAFSDAEIAYLFPQNDSSAYMLIVAQFPHSMKEGSDIDPHVHWKQTQSGSVVFKMDYKWFPIGGDVPSTFETHVMANMLWPLK